MFPNLLFTFFSDTLDTLIAKNDNTQVNNTNVRFLTVFLIDFLEMFEVRVSTIEIRADVYRLSENLALLRHLLI